MRHLFQWFRRHKTRRRARSGGSLLRQQQRQEFSRLAPEWQRLIAALGYAPPDDKEAGR